MPQSAPHTLLAPLASADATSACTAPNRAISSGGTSARLDLRSVAYTTSPPRTTALDPGTVVSAAATSPAVSDSAVATVCPRSLSSSTTSTSRSVRRPRAVTSGSLMAHARDGPTATCPQPDRADHVVDAGDHGQHHGGADHDPPHHVEPVRERQ